MNTDKIKELEEKRDSLWGEIYKLNSEINELQNADNNFVGHYVYSSTYGYMYVTHQKVIDEYIIFRGLTFNSDAEYYDETFFDSDSMGEWKFSFKNFLCDLKYDGFVSITREEYVEEFKKKATVYIKKFDIMLKYKEDKVKK